MFARDKCPSVRLSPGVVVVLILCIFNLAAHYIAEDLSPLAIASGLDPFPRVEQVSRLHDHAEDNFVFPCLTRPPVVGLSRFLPAPAAGSASAFSPSPLLPPPDIEIHTG